MLLGGPKKSNEQWSVTLAEPVVVTPEVRAEYDDVTGRKTDLLAAFDAVEAKNTPDVAEPKPVAAVTLEPKPAEDVEVPLEGTEPKPEGEGEVKPEPVEAKTELEAPSNWSKARKEQFAEQPESAKQFILDRHKEMEADYTRKTTEIADFKREYGTIDNLFTPYRDQMRQAGYTPATVVQAWFSAEQALMNPATRVQAIRTLATSYKVDLAELVGGQAQPTIDPNDPEAVARKQLEEILSPYVTPLRKQVEELSGKLTQQEQFRTQVTQSQRHDAQTRVLNEIQSFANAADAKGVLAHPYFNDVENDMAFMAAGYQQMNQPVPSLEDLYQRAVRANPATYERLQASQRVIAENNAKEAARTKAANAKRAGSSITGAPSSGQPLRNGADKNVSVREALLAAAEEHQLQ